MVRTFGSLPPSTTATTEDEEQDQDEKKTSGRGPDDDGHVGLLLFAARKTNLNKNHNQIIST
jgi:hypothetical protein